MKCNALGQPKPQTIFNRGGIVTGRYAEAIKPPYKGMAATILGVRGAAGRSGSCRLFAGVGVLLTAHGISYHEAVLYYTELDCTVP